MKSTAPICTKIFHKKPIEVIRAEEKEELLHRSLGLFDLLCIGIASTIGTGIFSTAGELIKGDAGPAAFIGWIFSGFVCLLSGFAFMELSTRIPSTGSCYAYTYHALGELPAMIAASFLTLEYGISGAGVARSWATKVYEAFHTPTWLNLAHANVTGALLHVICVVIVLLGINIGKRYINIMTTIKVGVVLFMIIVGGIMIQSENYTPLIPKEFGFAGIMAATAKGFFGYAGFDEVCCLAGEAKNPRRNMPLALVGVIIGSMVLTSLATFVLAGMVPYNIKTEDTISFGFAFQQHRMAWAQYFVQIGEIVTLPLVSLVCFLSQPRLHFAMAVDGLLPPIFAQAGPSGNLFYNTLITGILMTLVALIFEFELLWELINLGMLFAFNLVNASLLMVRTNDPTIDGTADEEYMPSPATYLWSFLFTSGMASFFLVKNFCVYASIIGGFFGIISVYLIVKFYFTFLRNKDYRSTNDYRAPLVPWIPAIAVYVNWYLISQASMIELLYEMLWILATIALYFCYGYQHSIRRSTEVVVETGRPSIASLTKCKTVGALKAEDPSNYLKADTECSKTTPPTTTA